MRTWFGRWVAYVQRIPTLELTVQFFWSLMFYGLVPADRTKVALKLLKYVGDAEKNIESEDYE
jgi:hypothetical protein